MKLRTPRTLLGALLALVIAVPVQGQAVDLTARGSGPYIVYVDGVEYSRHTTEREAVENVTEALAADPTAAVYYVHEYTVDAALVGVVTQPPPPPPPPTDTTTVPQDTTVTNPPPPPPTNGTPLPAGYDLDRIPANALLAGDDWSNRTGTADVCRNFYHSSGDDPCNVGSIELVNDDVFGNVVQGWQMDGSAGHPNSPKSGWGYSRGAQRVALRVTVRHEVGFTPGQAWKMLFESRMRLIEVTGDQGGFVRYFDPHGGSGRPLPGTRDSGGFRWGNLSAEYANGEWAEIIAYMEQLPDRWRVRVWVRQISRNGQIIPRTNDPAQDYQRAYGMEAIGGNAGAGSGIELGITLNQPTPAGTRRWFRWGPFEVIDMDVVADPYGLAGDML